MTKITLTFVLLCFIGISVYCQTPDNSKQTKAEYLLELMQTSSTTRVFIVAKGFYKEYNKEWLSDVSINGSLIILKKGASIDTWDLRNAVFFEKYDNTIKVRLAEEIMN